MQDSTVDFKLDVSNESIKRNVMKVVWMFKGVTFVDIKEKGQVKVRGNFDMCEMGTQLHEIDNSVDFIDPMEQAEQNYKPVISSISSYFNVSKVQEIVVTLEFEVLNERIKPEVMEVIWEFSGITSVEVVQNRQVKVKGEKFNKLEMVTTLKKIDKSVKIVTNVEAKPEVKQAFNNGGVGSSKGPTHAQMFGGGLGLEGAEKAKVPTPVNNKWDRARRDLNIPQGVSFGAQNNRQPPKKQEKAGFIDQIQDWMKQKPEVKQAQHERDPEAHYARFGPYVENNHRYGNNPYARLADSSTSKTGETSQTQTQGSRGNSSYSNSSSMGTSLSGSSQRTMSSQHSQTSVSMRDQRSQQSESRSVNQGRGGNSVKSFSSFSSQSRKQ